MGVMGWGKWSSALSLPLGGAQDGSRWGQLVARMQNSEKHLKRPSLGFVIVLFSTGAIGEVANFITPGHDS